MTTRARILTGFASTCIAALIAVGILSGAQQRSPQGGGAFLPGADYDMTGQVTLTRATLTAPVINGAGTTTTNLGTVGASTVTAVEKGDGVMHQTVLTLTAVSVALSQANVGGGTKIYTFPEGNITVLGATGSVAETTTSAILTTLNGGKTLSAGVGSVATTTQGSGTLVTTQQDVLNAFAPVSSTVISTAAAASAGKLSATTALRYDGSGTAQAIYLNCGIPTASDIDGDATSTWTGTVTITWMYNGDT